MGEEIIGIQTEYIDVVLRGTPEQLELVTSENIRAVADLSDYNESTGQYMASVKVYIDNAADVGPIGDYSISVILRKA